MNYNGKMTSEKKDAHDVLIISSGVGETRHGRVRGLP